MSSSHAPRPGRLVGAHLPGLDGVRGVAVLLVMVNHALEWGHPHGGVHRLLVGVAGAGWTGVSLFFVLSGFLITGILLDTAGDGHYYRTFFARRALRILPLYAVVLAMLLWVLPALGLIPKQDAERLHANQWWLWAFGANVLIALRGWRATPGGAGHLWSLAIEEQFYLVWPAVVRRLSRRRLIQLCLAALVAGPLLRAALLIHGSRPLVLYVLLPTRSGGLAMGSLLAVLLREPGVALRLRRWARPAMAAAALVFLGIVVRYHGAPYAAPGMQLFGYSAINVMAAGMVLAAATDFRGSRIAALCRSDALQTIGRHSYALYLIHLPVIVILRGRAMAAGVLPRAPGLWPQLGFAAVALALSGVLAVLARVAVERPFLALKRFVPYERTRPAPVAAPEPIWEPELARVG